MTEEGTPKGADKAPKERSPNYPAIGLERALGLAQQFYEKARTYPFAVDAVFKDIWKMSPKSSGAKQQLAALRAYGLIEVADNKAKISLSAHKILEQHPERSKLLRAAALNPRIHALVWEKFAGPQGLAPDDPIRQFLLWELNPRFTKEAIPGFISQFRTTLAFAGLNAADTIPETGGGSDEEDEAGDRGEGGGQNPEGSLLPPADPPDPPATPSPPPRRPGMNQDVFTLAEGNVVLQWPTTLSRESFDDLKSWLEIMERKIGRAVAKPTPPVAQNEPGESA